MRKVLTFFLIFLGTILTVFVLNIVMYAVNPDYHDMISAAVATSGEDIPVVTPDMVKEMPQSGGDLEAQVPEKTEDSLAKESPMVTVNSENGNSVTVLNADMPDDKKADEDLADANANVITNVKPEKTSQSEGVSQSKKPIVIDKEYHEDCGTGEGYWVLTYSDGSVVIE